jgi:biopolymer transport protein ExbB
MQALVDAFLAYVEQGGYVMPALIGAALLVWYGLGYRIALLWRGGGRPPRLVLDDFRREPERVPRDPVELAAKTGLRAQRAFPRDLSRALEWQLGQVTDELDTFRALTKTIVAAAPLLGLLGTVSGMIETFAALGDSALFSQSGGIAGGISKALLTTQFGLSIAIPGLVVGNFLERRQRLIEDRIEETKAILIGKDAG